MSSQEQGGKSGLVFGAGNLGGAIIETLIGAGWSMAGVARSEATLEQVAHAGTLADAGAIADAVRFLAVQAAPAATHELQVTPLVETWVH